MTRERRDYPLGRISISSSFIHVVRLKHFRDVSSGTVGIEWCFDLHKTVENRGTVVAVCYGRREAAVGRTAGWVTERLVTDARLWRTALYAMIDCALNQLPTYPSPDVVTKLGQPLGGGGSQVVSPGVVNDGLVEGRIGCGRRRLDDQHIAVLTEVIAEFAIKQTGLAIRC